MKYVVEKRIPTLEEFNYLREAAGWPLLKDELTREGLSRSLFGACISLNNQVVGMGRVIGDNAIYFHIQDVIVHPSQQGKGLGKLIMNALLEYIDRASGANSNIGLMCSKGREKFYERFGFTARPTAKFGAGMIKIRTEL
jgi:GNAT superfamily N-acetyltransferase